MVEASALESLVQRLTGFNEANDDEAEAVANTLATFENMVELSPQVRTRAGRCANSFMMLSMCLCTGDIYSRKVFGVQHLPLPPAERVAAPLLRCRAAGKG